MSGLEYAVKELIAAFLMIIIGVAFFNAVVDIDFSLALVFGAMVVVMVVAVFFKIARVFE